MQTNDTLITILNALRMQGYCENWWKAADGFTNGTMTTSDGLFHCFFYDEYSSERLEIYTISMTGQSGVAVVNPRK